MAKRRRQRRTVYVGETRWKVQRGCRLRDAYGICDYATRTIKLRSGLVGLDLLDTILHELLHARWPDLSEDAVAEFSETVSGFLYAEGFRQGHDDEED